MKFMMVILSLCVVALSSYAGGKPGTTQNPPVPKMNVAQHPGMHPQMGFQGYSQHQYHHRLESQGNYTSYGHNHGKSSYGNNGNQNTANNGNKNANNNKNANTNSIKNTNDVTVKVNVPPTTSGTNRNNSVSHGNARNSIARNSIARNGRGFGNNSGGFGNGNNGFGGGFGSGYDSGYGGGFGGGSYSPGYSPTYSYNPSYDFSGYSPSLGITSQTPYAALEENWNTAALSVEVPNEDAEVWLNGEKMPHKGLVRKFVTPPLHPQGLYNYDLTVKWVENGVDKEQSVKVPIRAKDDLTHVVQDNNNFKAVPKPKKVN